MGAKQTCCVKRLPSACWTYSTSIRLSTEGQSVTQKNCTRQITRLIHSSEFYNNSRPQPCCHLPNNFGSSLESLSRLWNQLSASVMYKCKIVNIKASQIKIKVTSRTLYNVRQTHSDLPNSDSQSYEWHFGTSSIGSIDSPLSSFITPHSFIPGLKPPFLQILPTVPSFSSLGLTPRIPRTVYWYFWTNLNFAFLVFFFFHYISFWLRAAD